MNSDRGWVDVVRIPSVDMANLCAESGEDWSTPPTRQPIRPEEGGSRGPEHPEKLPPIPPTVLPDPGIKPHRDPDPEIPHG